MNTIDTGVLLRGFGQDTTDDDVAAWVDVWRTEPHKRELLLTLLPERHALYTGRSENDMVRIRGYIMASFEQTGLPEEALAFVLDELENSHHAYMVAAAARALRGSNSKPVYAQYLVKALNNIRYADEQITFDCLKPQWPLQYNTSAVKEICKSLQWLGTDGTAAIPVLQQILDGNMGVVTAALKQQLQTTLNSISQQGDGTQLSVPSCCQLPNTTAKTGVQNNTGFAQIQQTELQDQSGATLPYSNFFTGAPAAVTFFYTRCGNPNKCALTVTKMGQLQQLLKDRGLHQQIKTAIVTYDPLYDTAPKIKAYGKLYGYGFDDNHRAMRTTQSGFETLQQFFELGVNYSGNTVNQHRIELYLLDKEGRPAQVYSRLQWDIEEVVNELEKLLINNTPPPPPPVTGKSVKQVLSTALPQIGSGLPPLLIAFFPKCPVCWAAYLSAFGVTGLNAIPYSPWLIPVFAAIMGINLFVLARSARQRNGLFPFTLSLTGALILLIFVIVLKIQWVVFIAIAFIVAGSLLNSLSFRMYLQLKLTVLRLFSRLLPGTGLLAR